jgi:hypothetical protein
MYINQEHLISPRAPDENACRRACSARELPWPLLDASLTVRKCRERPRNLSAGPTHHPQQAVHLGCEHPTSLGGATPVRGEGPQPAENRPRVVQGSVWEGNSQLNDVVVTIWAFSCVAVIVRTPCCWHCSASGHPVWIATIGPAVNLNQIQFA